MTWQRHRPKGLAWTLLATFVLILGLSVSRYTGGEVAPGDDVLGVVLRVVVLAVIVLLYLRSGGSTSADAQGLVVHDGVRRQLVPPAAIERVTEHTRRPGAVALLKGGRVLELPGVPVADLPALRRALRRRR